MTKKGVYQFDLTGRPVEIEPKSPRSAKSPEGQRELPKFVQEQLEARRSLPEDGEYTAECGCVVGFRRGARTLVSNCPDYYEHNGLEGIRLPEDIFPTESWPKGTRLTETIGKPKPIKRAHEGALHRLKCGCVIRVVRPIGDSPLPLRCERVFSCRLPNCDWARRKRYATLTTTPERQLVEATLPHQIRGYRPREGSINILDCGCRIKWIKVVANGQCACCLITDAELLAAVRISVGSHEISCEYESALQMHGLEVLAKETDLPHTGS